MTEIGRVTFTIANASDSDFALPDFGGAPEEWRDNVGAVCARGIVSDEHGWVELPGVGTFRFDREHLSVMAIPHPSVSDDVLRDSYYRAALPLALHFFGFEVLHASAALTPLGVVAFCAVSETGKSTTVAALSRRGYKAWADDAVPVEIDDGGRCAHALAVPFRLRVDSAASPSSGQGDRPPFWPKPGPIELRSTPLVALCVMRRVDSLGRAAEIRRLTAVEAVAALLPHGYCFSLADPDRKRSMLQRYVELAARVPTYEMTVASGLEKLPAVLDRIERAIPGFNHAIAP
jgi:hypothetical protein